MFHCLPNYLWADGSLAEVAGQLDGTSKYNIDASPCIFTIQGQSFNFEISLFVQQNDVISSHAVISDILSAHYGTFSTQGATGLAARGTSAPCWTTRRASPSAHSEASSSPHSQDSYSPWSPSLTRWANVTTDH